MAASMLTRLALQTSRLTAVALRQHTFCAAPSRSFSASSCIFASQAAGKRYTEKHEWIEHRKPDKSSVITVGISDYAQESLGEIVYVELPDVGAKLDKEDTAGCVESVKAASDIYCPISGTVFEINTKLESEPGLINKSPGDEGWLFKLDVPDSSAAEFAELMDEEAYKKYTEDK